MKETVHFLKKWLFHMKTFQEIINLEIHSELGNHSFFFISTINQKGLDAVQCCSCILYSMALPLKQLFVKAIKYNLLYMEMNLYIQRRETAKYK